MSKSMNGKWDYLRDADLSPETVDPEPVPVLVYQCPLNDCSKTSETEYGYRQHVGRAHDWELVRATMACAYCDEEFSATYSEMESRAFCSNDCKYEAGFEGDPVVVNPPLSPDLAAVVRYPCPVSDCSSVCDSERGLRRHATQQHDGLGRVTRDCEECGQTFHSKPAEADTARFCSQQCLYESRRDRVTLTCEGCSNEFEIRRNRLGTARFCSWDCFAPWLAEFISQFANLPKYDLISKEPEDVGLSPIGEHKPWGSMPYTGPIIDWRVSRDQCLTWRRSVLSSNDVSVVEAPLVPDSIVRKHVTGDCEHGFDASVMPLRHNGAEWTSTAVQTAEQSIPDPSRRGATFDG